MSKSDEQNETEHVNSIRKRLINSLQLTGVERQRFQRDMDRIDEEKEKAYIIKQRADAEAKKASNAVKKQKRRTVNARKSFERTDSKLQRIQEALEQMKIKFDQSLERETPPNGEDEPSVKIEPVIRKEQEITLTQNDFGNALLLLTDAFNTVNRWNNTKTKYKFACESLAKAKAHRDKTKELPEIYKKKVEELGEKMFKRSLGQADASTQANYYDFNEEETKVEDANGCAHRNITVKIYNLDFELRGNPKCTKCKKIPACSTCSKRLSCAFTLCKCSQ